jgi:hypothetical protein
MLAQAMAAAMAVSLMAVFMVSFLSLSKEWSALPGV